MIFHDIDQNSDDWFDMRAGMVTSSKLGVVMANYGKAFGEPAKKYAVNIAVEQITGKAIPSQYTNDHMGRGHEQEPLARMEYEEAYFCEVTNGGFFDCGDYGASPDGRVGESGAIEIKSVIPSTHYATIARGALDPAYKWQVIGTLSKCNFDWIDFVSYCQPFPDGKRIFVHRVTPDAVQNEIEMIDKRLAEFNEYVQAVKDKILNGEYFV